MHTSNISNHAVRLWTSPNTLEGEASHPDPEHRIEPYIFAQTGLGQTQMCYCSQCAHLGLELSQRTGVWRLVCILPCISGTANTKRFAKLSTGWSLLHHDWKSLQGDTFIHRCLCTIWEPPVEIHGLCYTKGQIWSQALLAFKPEKLWIVFKECLWQLLCIYSTTHGKVRIIMNFLGWGIYFVLSLSLINKSGIRTKQS